MKMCTWATCIIVISLARISCSAEELPAYADQYVNDFAGILNTSQTNYLRVLMQDLEENTSVQVTLVTVITTAPDTPADYRTKLFSKWGVGKAGKDNGVLILYATTEQRIEVEVGYGLEGILPDSKLGRMLDEYYVPLRDQGRFIDGILSFTGSLVFDIRQNYVDSSESSYVDPLFTIIVVAVIVIGGIIFLIFFIGLIKGGRRRGGGQSDRSWGGSTHHHYGFGGGFGGGGHHGGFGGGRSGGGGAGR